MIIGPKYKIAKRLGAPIFEKTQTQKFALSEARSSGNKRGGRPRRASDYKKQLTEKQKMRFFYGVSEKQFSRYVKEAVTKSHQPIAELIIRLESRLDNVVYRLGLAKTRQFARQMVSHGHIFVNGKRLSSPAHKVKIGDIISVREQSKPSPMFQTLVDDYSPAALPSWAKFDIKKLEGEKVGEPTFNKTEALFDPELVLEYYSR